MSEFKSYSQAGQDRFVVAVLDGFRGGTFVDCGCSHPVELSNTYGLETQLGWSGILADRDLNAIESVLKTRSYKNDVLFGNALELDWKPLLEIWTEASKRPAIDYLSLDCDECTLDLVKAMIRPDAPRFRVATIEHDSYRFGHEPRDRMREHLSSLGYFAVCLDLCSREGLPFEDWWVDPKTVESSRYERFICTGNRWTEILPE